MWSWISAPSVSDGTTQPFRVASVKTQGATFLQRMAALLGDGADSAEAGPTELPVPRLRLVSFDEDIEANLQQGGPPGVSALQGQGQPGQQQEHNPQQQHQPAQQPQELRKNGLAPGSQQEEQPQPPRATRRQDVGAGQSDEGLLPPPPPLSHQQRQQEEQEEEGVLEGQPHLYLHGQPGHQGVCAEQQWPQGQEHVGEGRLPQDHQKEQQAQPEPTMCEAPCGSKEGSQPHGQPARSGDSCPAQEEPRPGPEQEATAEGQAAGEGSRARRQRKRPARFAEYVEQLLPAAQRRVGSGVAASAAAATKAAKPIVGGQPGRSPPPSEPSLPKLAPSPPQTQARAEGGPVMPPPGSAAAPGAQGAAEAARQQAQPWRPAGRQRLASGVPWREGKPQRVALLEECQGVVDRVKRQRREATLHAAQVLHSVQSVLDFPPVVQAQAALTQQEAASKAFSDRLGEALTKREGALDQDLVAEGEVVVHVSVLLPRQPATSVHPSQEFLLLGSQPLTALRDAIQCLTDENVEATQRQMNATCQATGQPPVQLVKGGAYLYVEGTFYNDTREPGNADYSEPIRRFNREHEIPAPPHPPPGYDRCDQLTTEFSSAAMESTTFDQLWLRLGPGAVNLYCHQGGCEHAVVFKDARLFDSDTDPPLVSQYPFPVLVPAPGLHRYCEVCHATPAAKVTYDDQQAPHSPYFWCEECFKSMHYNKEGDARYTDYIVFPYTYEHRVQRQGGWLRP